MTLSRCSIVTARREESCEVLLLRRRLTVSSATDELGIVMVAVTRMLAATITSVMSAGPTPAQDAARRCLKVLCMAASKEAIVPLSTKVAETTGR